MFHVFSFFSGLSLSELFVVNNNSEERFSLLGLCIRENFVAGVKLCLEKKVGADECCAELRDFKTTRFFPSVCCCFLSFFLTFQKSFEWVHSSGIGCGKEEPDDCKAAAVAWSKSGEEIRIVRRRSVSLFVLKKRIHSYLLSLGMVLIKWVICLLWWV